MLSPELQNRACILRQTIQLLGHTGHVHMHFSRSIVQPTQLSIWVNVWWGCLCELVWVWGVGAAFRVRCGEWCGVWGVSVALKYVKPLPKCLVSCGNQQIQSDSSFFNYSYNLHFVKLTIHVRVLKLYCFMKFMRDW